MYDIDSIPDFISVTGLLKATPAEEGGERIIYLEASNESVDGQAEKVLSSALEASAADYEKFGNIDIDHITITGPRLGIRDYLLYEIGRPITVKIDGRRTYVKAQLYQGDSEVARQANLVWDSLTKISPPARWYPSVGGAVLEKGHSTDENGRHIAVVKKVRWTNTALSRTPVNQNVSPTATMPFGVFAKCWGPSGLDMTKALEAGNAYAIQNQPGGQALRTQSLDRHLQSYWGFRDAISGDIRDRKVKPDADSLMLHAVDFYHLSPDTASRFVERFFDDLDARRNGKRNVK